jgi:hypothetical protein
VRKETVTQTLILIVMFLARKVTTIVVLGLELGESSKNKRELFYHVFLFMIYTQVHKSTQASLYS